MSFLACFVLVPLPPFFQLPPFVYCSVITQVPQTEGLKQQKLTVSQFRRQEVQDQGAIRAIQPPKALGKGLSQASVLLLAPCLWEHKASLCTAFSLCACQSLCANFPFM